MRYRFFRSLTYSLFIALLFINIACSKPETTSAGEAAAEISWVYSLSEGLAAAQAADKPLMVDFYTDWCGWCKKLDKDTYSDATVKELAVQFINVKVDGDQDRPSVQKYGIRGYPTILFLKPNGEVIDQVGGYLPPDRFATRMKAVLNK